jgi:hypothetical protein
MSTVQLKQKFLNLLENKTIEQLNEDKELNAALEKVSVEWIQNAIKEGKLTVDEMFNSHNNALADVLTELELIYPPHTKH